MKKQLTQLLLNITDAEKAFGQTMTVLKGRKLIGQSTKVSESLAAKTLQVWQETSALSRNIHELLAALDANTQEAWDTPLVSERLLLKHER